VKVFFFFHRNQPLLARIRGRRKWAGEKENDWEGGWP